MTLWTEPVWKSLIVQTTEPLFTPQQCQDIIKAGRSQPREEGEVGLTPGKGEVKKNTRTSHISWIPFKTLEPMYKILDETIRKVNNNHYGYEGICLNEPAQYTEYPEGGFYEWHTDSEILGKSQPPVRKISMTCLLSHESEFEGGGLELLEEGRVVKPKQGHAVFFSSFIRHRVVPVTKGNRKSLVVWFGGPSFK